MIALFVHSQICHFSGFMFVFAEIIQGIIDLHHDAFLLILAYFLICIVFDTKQLQAHLALRLSRPKIHIVIILFYFCSCFWAKNVALCMDSGAPLEIPTSSISQDDLFNEVERKEKLDNFKSINRAHRAIGLHILEFRRQEGMRLPGGFQTERLVEMLEEKYGAEDMIAIERHMRANGIASMFYSDTKSFFNDLKREGVKEALLRKEWNGRS